MGCKLDARGKKKRLKRILTFIAFAMPGLAWSQGNSVGGVTGSGNEPEPLPDYSGDTYEQGFSLPDIEELLQDRTTGDQWEPSFSISQINIEGAFAPDMVDEIEAIRAQALDQAKQNDGQWTQTKSLVLRDEITKAYIRNGYVNSGAIIRNANPSNGKLEIEIVEGKLNDMPIRLVTPPLAVNYGLGSSTERRSTSHVADEERKWRPLQLRESYVTSRLWPDQSETLNQVELQKRFQNLSADPAIKKIDAALAPGARPGEAKLFLDVQEQNPAWLYVNAASERAPSIGGERVALGGGVRNLVGYGDVLSFEVGVTEGLSDAVFAYNLPIGNSPFAISIHGEVSDAEVVEEPLTNLNVLSDSFSYGIGASYNILDGVSMRCTSADTKITECESGEVRSTLYDLTISADISQKQSKSELLGIPFSFSPGAVDGETDNIVAALSLNGVVQSPRQVAAGRVSINYGLEARETTAQNAPPENFVSVLSQGQYARRLFGELDHQIIARLDVQYSGDTLFSAERYAFGGIDSVRGYRKNQVLSDNAIVGSLEYRMGLEPLFKNSQTRFFDDWSVSLFGDAGYGWNSKLADPFNNSLASVGAQLNFDIFERATGSIFYGHQIEEIPTPRDEKFQDSGFGFRVTFKGI